MKVLSAPLTAGSQQFAIVASRFNDFIVNRLVDGAADALRRHGVAADKLTLVWVPGAWEIALAARRLAASGSFGAVICLGCVIRGQTPHFEYVAGEAAKGIASVAMNSGIPVTFGVVTADTLEQAIDRAGGKAGNKGAEAALAALEMTNLLELLPK